jgi:putative nucleotidyltransferase with HDIG domain
MIWITKSCLLNDAKPGMILGRPVVSDAGKVILSENTVLTNASIKRLMQWGVSEVFVKEPVLETSDNVISVISEQQDYSEKHQEIVRALRVAFERTRYFKEVPLAQMNELANQSVESMINSSGVLSHLKSIRRTDDYTFRHCVNVGIISGVLGKWLGIQGPMLKELVLGGLLHDIGKTQIPLAILNKPAKLTPEEMDIMQEHSTLGYELVKKTNALPQSILLGVWQHHERLDGTGYPFGLTGEEISPFARIIAIADVYDAMTTDRVYHKAATPFKVIEEVFSEMFDKLDPVISMTFLNNLRDSLIGYVVRLSDGSEARVIYMDKSRMTKPIVKVADGRYLDLEKRLDLGITEVIAT